MLNQLRPANRPAFESGFTLVELLVSVAIVGILSALAIPAYKDSVYTARRSVAQFGTMDLANRQEQFYLNNKTYTSDMSNLGYTAGLVFTSGGDSAVALNSSQALVASTSDERIYFIKIDSASASAFSVSAVPQRDQADDTECATLTLTSVGARTESGTGMSVDCW